MEVHHCSCDKINFNLEFYDIYIHILCESVFELRWALESISLLV